MEQSACSHQLRLLRNLGPVAGERHGRSVIYALYDNHVAELLEQALFHVEHRRLGLRDTPARATEDDEAPATATGNDKAPSTATGNDKAPSTATGNDKAPATALR